MTDVDKLIAVERAIRSHGIYYSRDGDGSLVASALRTKYPEAEINLVVLTLEGGFILGSNDLYRPEDRLL